MGQDVAILFLNAGRRVQLIEQFRGALREIDCDVRVIATDVSSFAPALHVADASFILPHGSEKGFVDELENVCTAERVKVIIPLIDPDLPVLAEHKAEIERTGARLLLSSAEIVEVCRNKVLTQNFLVRHGFTTPRILTLNEARSQGPPWFIKPCLGSASTNAFLVRTTAELEFFAGYVPDPVIQEYVSGTEITVDVFSDWNGNPLIAVPRERVLVRGGEVVVARVKRDAAIEALCLAVAGKLRSVGPINIQVIVHGEKISVIEINARFGGGVPLSMKAGAPFARWALEMSMGYVPNRAKMEIEDGLVMMRYHHAEFRRFPEGNDSSRHL